MLARSEPELYIRTSCLVLTIYMKSFDSLCKTHPFSTKYPLGYSYTFPVDSQQVNGRKVRAELDSSANSYTMGELISKEAG